MALINIYVGCGLNPNPGTFTNYSSVSCAQACGGPLNIQEIYTLCNPVDIGCIFYYASGPREGFMVDPGFYAFNNGTTDVCYEIIRGPKWFSILNSISNCGSAPGACVEYIVTNFGATQEGVSWTNCASGLPESQFLDPSTNTSFCSSTFPNTTLDVVTVGPCTVICEDYFNNTGSALTGISYIACGGGQITNATVNPGQSICIAPGTGGGGDFGFLTLLGNC